MSDFFWYCFTIALALGFGCVIVRILSPAFANASSWQILDAVLKTYGG